MQISAGALFEMLRPAAFVLAVLLSAWVLADGRRRGLRAYVVGAWTLLTLLSPPIVFPLYLVARMLTRRFKPAPALSKADAAADSSSGAVDSTASESPLSAGGSPVKWRRTLPLVYAALVLSLAALFFLRDYRSVDAHLARAEHAKLFQQTDRAIDEYRAALRLEDDPHTRKLLAVELAARGRTEEALAEFLAAERGGEPDERLPFHLAATLDALKRPAEAQRYYRNFLDGVACARTPPDARCETAQTRLRDF